MSSRRKVFMRILALLQRKTLNETKNRTLKCLKRHFSTVRSMKNVAALTKDGAFALFCRPHPGRFESSRVPTSGNLPSKEKKMLMPGGQLKGGGGGVGGGLGAAGIDWCIRWKSTRKLALTLYLDETNQSVQTRIWYKSDKTKQSVQTRIYIYNYISSRIYENRAIGLQEPTQLKLTQLE